MWEGGSYFLSQPQSDLQLAPVINPPSTAPQKIVLLHGDLDPPLFGATPSGGQVQYPTWSLEFTPNSTQLTCGAGNRAWVLTQASCCLFGFFGGDVSLTCHASMASPSSSPTLSKAPLGLCMFWSPVLGVQTALTPDTGYHPCTSQFITNSVSKCLPHHVTVLSPFPALTHRPFLRDSASQVVPLDL